MGSISFLSAVCVVGAVQGVLLIVALQRIEARHRVANRLLSVLLGLIVIALLVRLVRHESSFVRALYPQVLLLMDGPLYAYGPLLYLYLHSLTRPAAGLRRRWWLHFVPAALHFARQLEYWLEPPAAFAERLQTGHFPFAVFIVTGAVVQMGIYIFASLRLVYAGPPEAGHAADRRSLEAYVKTVLVLVGLAWAAWGYCVLAFFTRLVPDLRFVFVDAAWIIMSLFPMVLAYFAIGRQEVFKFVPKPRRYEGSLLAESDLTALQLRLCEVMTSAKPYLQAGLTLADLAELVGCPPKDLSRVINERFDLNFFDFVNRYRVTAFKQLAMEERYRNQTVLAIAYDAGFNSKTTFYAAFKKFSELAPAEYLTALEAARLRADPAPEPR